MGNRIVSFSCGFKKPSFLSMLTCVSNLAWCTRRLVARMHTPYPTDVPTHWVPSRTCTSTTKNISFFNQRGQSSRIDILRVLTNSNASLQKLQTSARYEYVEVQKEKYEKAESAIKEVSLPFLSATDFIEKQLETVLEKYKE